MKEDRITIKDIAREAGVSKSTVSRAINNGHGIDIKTKDKILDIIEKYNFSPSKSARELRGKKSRTVGILATRLHSNSETETIRGMIDIFYKNDVEYVIFETDFSIDKTRKYYETLIEKGIDEIVIFAIANENYDFIKEKDGVIIIGQDVDGFDNITYEDYNAIKKISNYLWEVLRKRKIGYIGLVQNDFTTGKQRYLAYEDFVNSKKIKNISYFGDFKYKTGYEYGMEMLENEVDSVICATDNIALGLRKYLFEKSREDIIVSGVGNNDLLSFLYRDHITVDFLYKESGEHAGKLMIEKIKRNSDFVGETINNKKVFKSKLVVNGKVINDKKKK